jgi:XRE family aerobic/anaerobic benzoate catabolism transcriptional regulator
MINLSTIGRKIAAVRAKRGLSQEDLAGEAEIARNYISRIENGHVAFSILVLLKIAKALKTDPKAFFE